MHCRGLLGNLMWRENSHAILAHFGKCEIVQLDMLAAEASTIILNGSDVCRGSLQFGGRALQVEQVFVLLTLPTTRATPP